MGHTHTSLLLTKKKCLDKERVLPFYSWKRGEDMGETMLKT